MMVARHEMPGNVALRNRPVGYGMIRCRGRPVILESGQVLGATDHTVPYGTDHVRVFSRHFMPGYHHFVPTGRCDGNTPTLQHSSAPFGRIRGQLVRRSQSSTLRTAPVGLASEARSTIRTLAKSEGRERERGAKRRTPNGERRTPNAKRRTLALHDQRLRDCYRRARQQRSRRGFGV